MIALPAGTFVDYPAGRRSIARRRRTGCIRRGTANGSSSPAATRRSGPSSARRSDAADLIDDPRFGSWLSRRDNADALTPLIEAAFKSKPRDEWLEILAEYDIPAAGTQPLRDFMSDPAVLHHKMAVTYDHPEVGRLDLDGPAPAVLGVARARRGSATHARPDTAEILREAGYADADIADLVGRGVVAGKGVPAR